MIQPTLHQCLMIAFKKYSNELNLLQRCYENEKVELHIKKNFKFLLNFFREILHCLEVGPQ